MTEHQEKLYLSEVLKSVTKRMSTKVLANVKHVEHEEYGIFTPENIVFNMIAYDKTVINYLNHIILFLSKPHDNAYIRGYFKRLHFRDMV